MIHVLSWSADLEYRITLAKPTYHILNFHSPLTGLLLTLLVVHLLCKQRAMPITIYMQTRAKHKHSI